MAAIDSIQITEADRKKWPYMDNDGGRRAMKHVAAQTDEFLLACVAFDRDGDFDHGTPAFVAFLGDFGKCNPQWLSCRIGESLYDRGVIDETKFDRIAGH